MHYVMRTQQRHLVVMRQQVVAVPSLCVCHGVTVRERWLRSVVHVAQILKFWAPLWQPVADEASAVLLLATVANVHTGGVWPQWTEASCWRPRAFHAPDVVRVRWECLTVIVRLPDNLRHVGFKVSVRVRLWRRPADRGGVVNIGTHRRTLMHDAEVGGARAARRARRVDFLLGTRWWLDERCRGARWRLRQTGT